MHTQSSGEQFLLNEQWSQSYVGIAINDTLRRSYDNDDAAFVSFETCVSWLEDFAGHERRPGRPPGSLRKAQRFDIVVWSKGGNVAGVVEIKDQPVMQNYTHTADPKKLCGALRRWPSIRWGLFHPKHRRTKEASGVASSETDRSTFVLSGAAALLMPLLSERGRDA